MWPALVTGLAAFFPIDLGLLACSLAGTNLPGGLFGKGKMFESSQPAKGAFSAVVRRIQVRQFGEPDEEQLHNEEAQLNAGHHIDNPRTPLWLLLIANPHFGLVICCDSDV